MPETKAPALALSGAQVATYIKLGRQKVMGSAYDTYARYKNPTQAMLKDAMLIASWYNGSKRQWTTEQRVNAFRMIRDIQKGPAFYYHTLLRLNLSVNHMLAAASWANRHNAGEYVDVSLCVEARDEIFSVLNPKLRLDKSPEPYWAMLDALRFVFHGLPTENPDGALHI